VCTVCYNKEEKTRDGDIMPVKVGLKHIEIWNDSMENQVLAYEKEQCEKGQIVFYGPSYFTRWGEKWGFTPLREAIVGKSGRQCCVNRGFGSSCSEHQLYYYPRMIRPLEPKVLVYSSHGNGDCFGYGIEEIWELAQRVAVYALTDFPDIHVYLCGANPSRDASDEAIEKKLRYDEFVREFAEKTERCCFVDINGDDELRERKDIYVPDGVHYNAEGYEIYARFFRDVLSDELAKY